MLAIRRETKPREQRAPLAPAHVRALVARGISVAVERSPLRTYRDAEYADAGATLVEGAGAAAALDGAAVVLGVKEFPAGALRVEQTICCFAHVIKAQSAGMPLLDALLAARARLVDYEAVTSGGVRGGARLVAFGRHAGIAGAIDALRGVGERALAARGVATPFLGVAATWQYPTLDAAFAAVRAAGAAIAARGLPDAIAPFVVAVTGLQRAPGGGGAPSGGGRVARGAREVLELLPLRWVEPAALAATLAAAAGRERTHVVYAVAVDAEDCVERRGGGGGGGDVEGGGAARARSASRPPAAPLVEAAWAPAPFDRAHYKAAPDEYAAVFHRRVLPHVSLLVHCSYWEPRFPRLVTAAQARALSEGGALRLIMVEDISCDVGGAIEFMRPTTMGAPFFVYDPASGAALTDIAAAPDTGVLYSAVDHLPSECPRDATDHFGDCLAPLLPPLVAFAAAEAAAAAAGAPPRAAADAPELPPELRGAVVTELGALAANWRHIASLRAAQARVAARRATLEASRPASPAAAAAAPAAADDEPSATFTLTGHVFDSGLLTPVLDAVEGAHASSEILSCVIGRTREEPTTVRMRVFAPAAAAAAAASGGGGGDGGAAAAAALRRLLESIAALAAAAGVACSLEGAGGEDADGRAGFAPPPPAPPPFSPAAPAAPVQRVLLLGSGFVAGPAVEALLRRPRVTLTVASAVLAEAAALVAAHGARARAVQLDVARDAAGLAALVEAHDLVISLIPAPLHAAVARAAIATRRNMVTSSYVSPALEELHGAAVAAGVTILNECGLDPGIDHMTVSRLVDALAARGGVVTHFSSLCGGLPAPEAANNPLCYKWSWSPRGALVAMLNGATYRDEGARVDVAPGALLAAAARARLASHPAFALEALPNRDALPYAAKYGCEGPHLVRMFRGTLRYEGFSARLATLRAAGLLNVEPAPLPAALAGAPEPLTLRALLGALLGCAAAAPSAAELAAAAAARPAAGPVLSLADAAAFFEWLRLDELFALVRAEDCGAGGPFLPLDSLAAFLAAHPGMAIARGERDCVVMSHTLRAAFPGGRVEEHTSELLEFGAPHGATAMARTVGLTAAAAAGVILDGRAPRGAGVCTPIARAWYEPILAQLAADGIAMTEGVTVVAPGA